ncbi:MAG: hypothetical protein HYS41_05540 [Candidatus Omnitrophica bacterium]|nr:hypothetical protein [Candidatus Omnitrophota bacterium]
MRYTPGTAMEAINAAFLRLSKAQVRELLRRRQPLSLKHGMSMFDEGGQARVIPVQLRPWLVDEAQRRYFYRHCLILRGALSRLTAMYLADPKVRRVIPLEPLEHEWLREANRGRPQRPQPVVDRIDATATFARPDWKEFWFLEPNSVGIGGIHYIPATCSLTADWVLPALKRELPGLRWAAHDDIRWLIFKLLVRHSKAIGRKLKRVALVEDQSEADGTDEFPWMARYLKRQGLDAVVVDPRDIRLKKGELAARGKGVDLFYRDTEITEMIRMPGRAKMLPVLKEAFRRNQVISSIAGEFDHKSAWELLTNPEFGKHFTPGERALFKARVLWTRLLWERKTTDVNGKRVDLAAWTRRHREELLIKPNRAYGGEGVVFGHQASPSVWENKLARALEKPYTHVVQRATRVHAELFPAAHPDGSVELKPYFAVTGFAASPDGIAFLGRASRESVVNVSRRGGLIAIWKLA